MLHKRAAQRHIISSANVAGYYAISSTTGSRAAQAYAVAPTDATSTTNVIASSVRTSPAFSHWSPDITSVTGSAFAARVVRNTINIVMVFKVVKQRHGGGHRRRHRGAGHARPRHRARLLLHGNEAMEAVAAAVGGVPRYVYAYVQLPVQLSRLCSWHAGEWR